MSRLWGYISGCYIPRQLRYWLYTAYSKLFGVIVNEIELPMESYKSLGEFFARRLKDGARPICLDRPMVRDLTFILNTYDLYYVVFGFLCYFVMLLVYYLNQL